MEAMEALAARGLRKGLQLVRTVRIVRAMEETCTKRFVAEVSEDDLRRIRIHALRKGFSSGAEWFRDLVRREIPDDSETVKEGANNE